MKDLLEQAQDVEKGLVDSGATHALRPLRPGEPLDGYKKVPVTLANGQHAQLRPSDSRRCDGVRKIGCGTDLADGFAHRKSWAARLNGAMEEFAFSIHNVALCQSK